MTDSVDSTDNAKLKLGMAKALAVREAFFEVMKERQAEIVKRARAKLVAQGINVQEEELGTLEDPKL